MKSLETVQKWMKAFKIICVVLLVICLIGAAGLLLGIVAGNDIMGTVASYGGVEINGILDGVDFDGGNVAAACASGLVEVVFTVVLFIFAIKYLKKELKSGTPFTYEFAKNMKTLAILSLVLPIAASFICSVIANVGGLSESVGVKVNIMTALLLFAAAAVFKHGADIMNMGAQPAEGEAL